MDIRFSMPIHFLFTCPVCGGICGCVRFDCVFCLLRNTCQFRLNDLPRKVGKECYDCRVRKDAEKRPKRIEVKPLPKKEYPKKRLKRRRR